MTNHQILTLMLRAEVVTFTLTGDIDRLEEFVLLKQEEFNQFPQSNGARIANQVLELANHLRMGSIDEVEAKKQLRVAFA